MRRRRILSLGVGLAAAPVVRGAQPETTPTLRVDLAGILPGESRTFDWRGTPVFVRHRTREEIQAAREVDPASLPDPAPDQARVQREQWLVVIGECTHGGCEPTGPLGRFGGWYCLCHGSQFDTSGRVRIGPARTNLAIPPYRFTAPDQILIGP